MEMSVWHSRAPRHLGRRQWVKADGRRCQVLAYARGCSLQRRPGVFRLPAFFAYLHRCVEQPRLSRFDRYGRKDRSVISTWRTDGIDQPSLADAVEALNTPPRLRRGGACLSGKPPSEWTRKTVPNTINWEVNERVTNKGGVEWMSGSYRITPAGRAALKEQTP